MLAEGAREVRLTAVLQIVKNEPACNVVEACRLFLPDVGCTGDCDEEIAEMEATSSSKRESLMMTGDEELSIVACAFRDEGREAVASSAEKVGGTQVVSCEVETSYSPLYDAVSSLSLNASLSLSREGGVEETEGCALFGQFEPLRGGNMK